jgi:hypothetical protein
MTASEADKILKKMYGQQIMFTRENITEITALTLNDLSHDIRMKYIKNDGNNGKILFPLIEIIRYLSTPEKVGDEISANDMRDIIISRYGRKMEYRKKDIQTMTTMSLQTIARQKAHGLTPKKKTGRKSRKVVYDIDTLTKWMTHFIKRF